MVSKLTDKDREQIDFMFNQLFDRVNQLEEKIEGNDGTYKSGYYMGRILYEIQEYLLAITDYLEVNEVDVQQDGKLGILQKIKNKFTTGR